MKLVETISEIIEHITVAAGAIIGSVIAIKSYHNHKDK